MSQLFDTKPNILGLDRQEFEEFVQLKRFAERWNGDSDFRQQLSIDPHTATAKYNLKVNPDAARFIWDREKFAADQAQGIPAPPLVERLANIIAQQQELAQELREDIYNSVIDPRIKAWRKRQLARIKSQTIGEGPNGTFPLSFELSKGCSVGCWFCCVSASRLTETFAYTSENANLWQNVLELMKNHLGNAASEAFCYWATDPLDNKDYEKFALDFHNILGSFPSTTTALAVRDPERTRALLKLSQDKGCTNVRFSIISLKILDQIHATFTPEELNFVHLVMQNQEAAKLTKVSAGRARERKEKDPKINSQFVEQDVAVSCVSGFLVNMVDRRIQLISPCIPNDRWTNGHRVHQEATFSDINDLQEILEGMIAKHMPLRVNPEDVVRFRQDLKYESLSDGFQISTRVKKFKFRNYPYIKELGEIINREPKNAQEIADLLKIFGLPTANTFSYLNQLFDRGFLDDEPAL